MNAKMLMIPVLWSDCQLNNTRYSMNGKAAIGWVFNWGLTGDCKLVGTLHTFSFTSQSIYLFNYSDIAVPTN